MKGVNVLLLNEATMIEAMQEYLNKRAAGGLGAAVTSVERNGTTFKIIVGDPQ